MEQLSAPAPEPSDRSEVPASRPRGGVRPPNVLWISTHDINPDLGAYRGVWPGAEYADTPHLDRLAAEGAVYDNAYASAPVCAPSRSAVMTGCHPTAIGTLPMRTKAVPPPEIRLLPEYFRAAGYYCTNNVFTDFQVQTPPTTFDECSTTAHWRDRPTADTPFFAAFHSSITHESRLYYDDDAFAAETADVEPGRRHDPALAPLPPYHPDTPVFRRTWARYADLITQVDHWIGGLLDQLEEDGLAENTVVVFWSDHGAGVPRAKRWLLEAGLRVPLLVRWPGNVAPGHRRELVHLMDLAATTLTVCGIPVPPHLHSRPFLDEGAQFLDPNPAVYGARARIDEQEDDSLTVRDARFRYVRHSHPDRSPMQHSTYPDRFATWKELRELAFEDAMDVARGRSAWRLGPAQRSVLAAGRPREELYDHAVDPHELHDLSTSAAHADDLERLRALMDDFQRSYADPWPMPEAQVLEQWRPGGRPQRTERPVVRLVDGLVHASCGTPGASLGWTTQPPGELRELSDVEVMTGAPVDDGRHWSLYTGPLRPPPGATVRVGAFRLGFEASDEVVVPPFEDRDGPHQEPARRDAGRVPADAQVTQEES